MIDGKLLAWTGQQVRGNTHGIAGVENGLGWIDDSCREQGIASRIGQDKAIDRLAHCDIASGLPGLARERNGVDRAAKKGRSLNADRFRRVPREVCKRVILKRPRQVENKIGLAKM